MKSELRRNPHLQSSIKECKTHDLKELKRREWCALRAQETKVELEALERFILEDYTQATWFTLKRIAVEMGHDVEAAKNYCQSCVALGKSEFRINVFM